jgi:hypothetical protein
MFALLDRRTWGDTEVAFARHVTAGTGSAQGNR